MFVLAEFNVLRPEPGLLFWSILIFVIFWYLMSKFAFRPIAQALIKRENHIQDALNDAKKAKDELRKIQTENSKLMEEARAERSKMLKEAKEHRNQIVAEARVAAKEEANKIVAQANQEIESLKKTALLDVKNQVSNIALEVAEKVIQKKLSDDAGQMEYLNDLVKDINLS
ncbi:F0F1 ATP synthase subunit B [Membranihabitans marinus]|uniref:F0F1 ATP synthase subunit B n=1 Tax=Membranihabitans marinus TaxID=1227546 RepID=UPI001EFFB158|nr:F0F1 ATP synthase subunit B [Membranihabitans marinus]